MNTIKQTTVMNKHWKTKTCTLRALVSSTQKIITEGGDRRNHIKQEVLEIGEGRGADILGVVETLKEITMSKLSGKSTQKEEMEK